MDTKNKSNNIKTLWIKNTAKDFGKLCDIEIASLVVRLLCPNHPFSGWASGELPRTNFVTLFQAIVPI